MSLDQDWIKAYKIFGQYIQLDGSGPRKEPTAKQLIFAKKVLRRCIQTTGLSTSHMFILGKVAQRENRFKRAVKHFCNMYELILPKLETESPGDSKDQLQMVASTAAREASICAFHTGDCEMAVDMAERASDLDSNDYGLQVNRALAHLLAGRPQRALNILDRFKEELKDDVPARNIREVIGDVLNGKIKCPYTVADLEDYDNE